MPPHPPLSPMSRKRADWRAGSGGKEEGRRSWTPSKNDYRKIAAKKEGESGQTKLQLPQPRAHIGEDGKREDNRAYQEELTPPGPPPSSPALPTRPAREFIGNPRHRPRSPTAPPPARYPPVVSRPAPIPLGAGQAPPPPFPVRPERLNSRPTAYHRFPHAASLRLTLPPRPSAPPCSWQRSTVEASGDRPLGPSLRAQIPPFARGVERLRAPTPLLGCPD